MANFNISAAVVYQLGEELVSDEITALMELVKNAYDADADYANVIIDTEARTINENGLIKDCPNGFISIEDNGKGMNYNEIERGWLIISLSHKREMKRKGETTERGRTPMGDKGLGRLSTQRLGSSLDMVTSKLGSSHKNLVSFNWFDFDSEVLLTDVLVDIQDVPNPEKEKGTKLYITNLRNTHVWEREREAIRNKLSQLISPFNEVRAFQVYLTINGEEILFDEIAERIRKSASSSFQFAYYSRQLLTINGRIKLNKLNATGSDKDEYFQIIDQDQGKEFYNFLTNPNGKFYLPDIEYSGEDGWFVSFKQEIAVNGIDKLLYHQFLGSSELADPGSFIGEIDEFKLRPDEALDNIFNKLSEYKEFVRRQIGIRIFRDGFGIRPYGYQGNDWLSLAKNQTSGSSFYGLRPNNVIGFISLRGDVNGVLKEKTDREGFVENDYSRNFLLLMEVVRDRINTFIEVVRRGYVAYRDLKADDELGFGSQTYEYSLDIITATSRDAAKVEKQITDISASVEQAENILTEASNILQTDASAEVAESLSPMLISMQENLANVHKLIESTKLIVPKIKSLVGAERSLRPKYEQLKDQIAEFSELASLGIVTESFSHELVNISNRLAQHTKNAEGSVQETYNEDFAAYIEYVRSSVGSMRTQLSHLAPSLRYVREKQEAIPMKNFIKGLIKFYQQNDPQIKFVLDNLFEDFIIKANKGKMIQIVDNIVLNARYWVEDYKEKKLEYHPEIHFSSKNMTLIIWDNGLGVDATVEHSLFQSFVTTKAKGAGHGLGLFIVTQLLDTLDSTIVLLPERNEHSRRFKFAITLKNASKK